MKLIGSSIEEQYRKELEEGARHLLEDGGDPRLIDLLRQKIGTVKSAYYLSGYKLSGYQTCSLLVNGSIVCYVEISDETVESYDKYSIFEYQKGLNKQGQIKLQVALELGAMKRTFPGK